MFLKKTIYFCCFLMVAPQVTALSTELKKKYPYNVLTEDYGILEEKDLKSDIQAFAFYNAFQRIGSPLRYWQCFETKDISINYSIMDYAEEWNEIVGSLQISVFKNKKLSKIYIVGKGLGLSMCNSDKKRWEALMKDEKHICINGDFFPSEDPSSFSNRNKIDVWTIDRLKTKKGCAGYYESNCYFS